ncbi:MAG: site-2 protease family protein [Geminicoccaceae bacterium]|nr:site-2 protease family protein [Geminicoccaceae bacterium]
MPDLAAIGQALSVWAIPVVTAITFHEAAHGFVADRLGDDTARRQGRVTLNPIRHVDPFGTVLLPLLLLFAGSPFLFGYAKPVPVAFHRLNDPKRDMVWVALAGPAVNIAIAWASALVLHLLAGSEGTLNLWLWDNFENALLINVVLACFNMIPIPPLDGGRVLTGILPIPLARRFARVERHGFLILIGVIFLVPLLGRALGRVWEPLVMVLRPLVNAVHGLVVTLAFW